MKTEIGGCHRHFQPVTIKLQILEGRRPVFPTARSLSPIKAGRQGGIPSIYSTLNVERSSFSLDFWASKSHMEDVHFLVAHCWREEVVPTETVFRFLSLAFGSDSHQA